MNLSESIFFFIILLFSAVIHEYCHGWMAYYLGDSTAKDEGRLTFNPLVHIDPFGSILLPLILYFASGGTFLFAYAKPVPYNPYNLRDLKYGSLKVALAGPGANLFVAVVFGLLTRYLLPSNLASALYLIVYINIILAVFNLVPIPPLDGSKILYTLSPSSPTAMKAILFLERYGIIILFLFIILGFQLLLPIVSGLFKLVTGVSL